MGDAATANGGEGMLLEGPHLDFFWLKDSSVVKVSSASASLPRFWIIGRLLSELKQGVIVVVELHVVLVFVVSVLLLDKDRWEADDEDADERDDAGLQEISGSSAPRELLLLAPSPTPLGAEYKALDRLEEYVGVVEEAEGAVKRPPWCICTPSNPPIRSRNTNTFRRTSLVKGIYCRIRFK